MCNVPNVMGVFVYVHYLAQLTKELQGQMP